MTGNTDNDTDNTAIYDATIEEEDTLDPAFM